MAVIIPRPAPDEYAEWYAGYVSEVPEVDDLIELLARQGDETRKVFTALSEEQADFRYAADKWSVKDIVLHLADAERVFAFRALWFARGATDALPGFQEQAWARTADASVRGMAGLAGELHAARSSTVAMLRAMDEEMLARGGTASGQHVTVRALAWIIAGHELHHLRIVRERYLSA